jgi:hypothetical protein
LTINWSTSTSAAVRRLSLAFMWRFPAAWALRKSRAEE